MRVRGQDAGGPPTLVSRLIQGTLCSPILYLHPQMFSSRDTEGGGKEATALGGLIRGFLHLSEPVAFVTRTTILKRWLLRVPGAGLSNEDAAVNNAQALCLREAIYWRKKLSNHRNKCKITTVIVPKYKEL